MINSLLVQRYGLFSKNPNKKSSFYLFIMAATTIKKNKLALIIIVSHVEHQHSYHQDK